MVRGLARQFLLHSAADTRRRTSVLVSLIVQFKDSAPSERGSAGKASDPFLTSKPKRRTQITKCSREMALLRNERTQSLERSNHALQNCVSALEINGAGEKKLRNQSAHQIRIPVIFVYEDSLKGKVKDATILLK